MSLIYLSLSSISIYPSSPSVPPPSYLNAKYPENIIYSSVLITEISVSKAVKTNKNIHQQFAFNNAAQ